MSEKYEKVCLGMADKIKRIKEVIPDDFIEWHIAIDRILEKIENAKGHSYSPDVREEIYISVYSVFSMRALGDIYWPEMPPIYEWWNRLSEVLTMSNSLDIVTPAVKRERGQHRRKKEEVCGDGNSTGAVQHHKDPLSN